MGEERSKEDGRKTPGPLESKAGTACETDDRRKYTVSVGRRADGGGSHRAGDAPTTCRSKVQDQHPAGRMMSIASAEPRTPAAVRSIQSA